MTEDDIRSRLRELRDEPVPADSLARVRLGVAERTRPRRWLLGGAMVAAALAVVLMVLFRPVAAPPVRMARPVAPPPVVVAPEAAVNVVARPKGKPRRRVKTSVQDVVVRIETEDPDVVILLIGD